MEASMETCNSNKDSFRLGVSPFSKLSGQLNGTDGGESILGSSDSGGRLQHRNSKTEADILDKWGVGELHRTISLSMPTEAKPPHMVPYVKLWSFATLLDYALMVVGSSAAILHGATLPVVLVLLGRVVNSLGANQSHPDLAYQKVCQISLLLACIAGASILIAWLEVGCWMYTGERQAMQIRIRYLKALLSQNMAFFDTERGSDEIENRLSKDMLLIHGAIGEKVGGFIFNVTVFAVGILVAFLQTWQVALLTLCTVPLLIGIGIVYARLCKRFVVRAETSSAKSGSVAEEAITQIRTVQSLVGESRANAAFSKALQATAKLGIWGGVIKGVGVGVSIGIMNFTWALTLWYGGMLIRDGKTDGGALLAAVFNVMFGSMALGQALADLQVFRDGRKAAVKVFEVIDHERDRDLKGETFATVRGEIEFQSVHFFHPSCKGIPLFSELSLTIQAGQRVALVGSTGSGKSSLLMLLQRFYSLNSGEVTLDGKNIEGLHLIWYRMQIAFVSQEPALFSGTIRQNILYGNPDASDAEIVAAAKDANIHSFIDSLPGGYETLVGESEIQLTGGQKQQLAITRAIIRKPAIYLLDEATSALDAQSEQTMLQSLDSAMQGRTTIMVAHRLPTLQSADVIVVLDHGRVIEKGSHAQLLEQGDLSFYASYVRLQETRQAPGDDMDTSVVASRAPTRSASQDFKGSPPRSSLYSGTTSPLASLLQSPVTPSTPYMTLESNSYPTSPFVFELPPSPVTPSLTFSRENSNAIGEHLLEKDEEVVVKSASNVSCWSMCQIVGPEWLSISVGSLAAVITGCLNPLVTLYLTNTVELFYSPHRLEEKTRARGNLWCIVIAGLGAVNISSNIIQHLFYTRAGQSTSTLLCQKVFKAVMRNEVGWFDSDEHSSSVLTTKISSCGTMVGVAIGDRTPFCIQCFASLCLAVTIAFTIKWEIAAVTLILIPITTLGGSFKSRFLRTGFAGDLEKSHSKATRVATEAVLNIHTVAAFCLDQDLLNDFIHDLQVPLRQSSWRAQTSGLMFGISQAAVHAANALCIWYLALLIKTHRADFKSAFKVYQLLAWTGYLLAGALRFVPDVHGGIQAAHALLEIANRDTEIDPNRSDGQKPLAFGGKVELEHVTFCYPTKPNSVVLRDFNLTIPEGQTVALVGPSGCGKSTIISLLERFYDPTSGNVLVDGFNIRTLNLKWLRRQISLVQQEPVLFGVSIRENIRCGKGNATECEVIEAARKANAHSFISGLARGYDTVIGEQAVQLSRGQRQRVAIARAIIRDPQIFLLDEAAAGLDPQAEKVVQDALDNFMLEERRTTIVIAHRLASVQCADSIVFMSNGKIREQGSHSSLIALNGAYARLVRLQN